MPDLIISSLRGGRQKAKLAFNHPTREQLAWAAGLFEGEGSFTFQKRGKYVAIVAELGMTDEDRVRQFHDIIGVGNVTTHSKPVKSHWKTMYIWKTASFEGTQTVIAMLWSWLGPRRKTKAKEILSLWHEGKNVRRFTHADSTTVMKTKELLASGVPARKVAKIVNRSYGFVNHIKYGRTHTPAVEVAPQCLT